MASCFCLSQGGYARRSNLTTEPLNPINELYKPHSLQLPDVPGAPGSRPRPTLGFVP